MVESPLLLCRQGGESWRRLRMVSRSGGKVEEVGGRGKREPRGGVEQRRRDRDGEGEGHGHRRRPEQVGG